MKRLKALLIALSVIGLTGCNKNYWVGNYNFTKVHLIAANRCYEVESWKDDEIGIEVKLKDYGSIFLSEATYILIEDKCPICDYKGE